MEDRETLADANWVLSIGCSPYCNDSSAQNTSAEAEGASSLVGILDAVVVCKLPQLPLAQLLFPLPSGLRKKNLRATWNRTNRDVPGLTLAKLNAPV